MPDTQQIFDQFKSSHPYETREFSAGPLEYLAAGSGSRTILLLSGLFGRGESWFPLILRLEPKYRLLAPNYSTPDLQSFFRAVGELAAEQGNGPAHVVGQSFGGMMAQGLAQAVPDRVASLTLSHTAPPPVEKARQTEFWMKLLLRLPVGFNRALWRFRIRQFTRNRKRPPDPFYEKYRDELIASLTREELKKFLDYFLQLLRNYRFDPPDLDKWPGRIQIIESDNDPAVPAEAQRRLKELYPQAKVKTFDGTGHGTLIEKPDEYAAAIDAFVSGD